MAEIPDECFRATRSQLKALIHEVLDERMSDAELIAELEGPGLTLAQYTVHRERIAEVRRVRQADFRDYVSLSLERKG